MRKHLVCVYEGEFQKRALFCGNLHDRLTIHSIRYLLFVQAEAMAIEENN